MNPANKSNAAGHNIVLVGVDFSEASAFALSEAASIAARSPVAELHVVHVVPVQAAPVSIGGATVPELSYLRQIEDSGKVLDLWLAPFRQDGRRVAGHVRVGRADREVAQLASDVGADLIVVGTTGKQGLTRLLLGSVAESLVRHAPCAVLAHRPRAVPPWELIEPPCPDCLAVREATGRAKLWCDRHSQHHFRAHTYREVPDSFGVGSQTFR